MEGDDVLVVPREVWREWPLRHGMPFVPDPGEPGDWGETTPSISGDWGCSGVRGPEDGEAGLSSSGCS